MPVGVKKLLFILGGALLTGIFIQFSFDTKDLNESVTVSGKSLPPFLRDTANWSDSVMNSLSLEEKIGQLFMVAAYPDHGDRDKQRITNLIKKYHVGGIIFFQGTTEQVAELSAYYQSISKTPLLVAIDGEWGLAMRLRDGIKYPKEMTLGAITDEMLIYQMGKDIAKQLKDIGINVNFAPVVDINNNPQNPVINSRSFGELRANVARKGILYMKGLQDEGVLAFAKHFPGHGDTKTDSHKALPVIEYSKERLDSLELYPFRALINAGVAGVMVAHMNVVSLDTTTGLPSTLSPIIVDSLLKEKMGFKGLVVTDAMSMRGLANYCPPLQANIKAIKAGNDILLMPDDVENSIKAIVDSIKDNFLDEKLIEKSCRKIIRAKDWINKKLQCPIYSADSLNKPEYLLTRQHLVEASLTVMRNSENLLPLLRLDTLKIAHVCIGDDPGLQFSHNLRYYADVKNFDYSGTIDSNETEKLFDTLKNFNLVLVSLHTNSIFAERNFNITDSQIKLTDSLINNFPVVFAAFSNPYVLCRLNNLEETKAAFIAYENDSVTQTAAAHLIFGALNADGKLPVTINKLFPAGLGIHTRNLHRFKYVSPYEAGFDGSKLSKIDSIINDAIQQRAMPGCEVFAAKNGKVFLNKAYGFQTYSERKPVQTDDLYDLASLTKISATLPSLIKLDGEGKFNTDDKLDKYFPYMDTCNKGNILVKDILLHQAGLVAWIPFFWSAMEPVYPDQDLISTKYSSTYPIQIGKCVFVNKHIKYKDKYFCDTFSSEYPYHVARDMFMRKDLADTMWIKILNSELDNPGHYRYSDLGFYIFRKLVEQQTGKELDKYTDSVFYKPLGAYTLCFNPLNKFPINKIVPTENDIVFRRQIVHGYVHDPGAAMLGGVSGHAGLFASANDLGKLMQMYLNGGHYGNVDFLERKLISKYTNCAACASGNRRGLGFDKPEPDLNAPGPTFPGISTNSFGHTGFTGTMAWVDPDTGIVYIFLSNRVYPDAMNKKLLKMDVRTNVQKAIYDALLK